MGVLRIVRYGTEFSFRTRRIFFFIIFFVALTGVTLYAMNEISRENTDLLLPQKTVIIQQKSDFSITATSLQNIASQYPALSSGSDVYIVRYFYLSQFNMRVVSLDLNQPWSSNIVRPNEIRAGSYITTDTNLGNSSSSTYQILASQNLIPQGSINATLGVNMSNTYSVNSIQKFVKGDQQFNLKVVGLFDKPLTLPKNENWLMVPDSVFTKLVTFLGLGTSDVYGYEIVAVANGYSETLASIFLGNSVNTVDQNGITAQTIVGAHPLELTLNQAPKKADILSQATSTDLILLIGLIGSPIVATMYAFIISRFRTREMAVLKAVGYSNRNVQVMILSEIAVVSVIGFLISVFFLQILFIWNAEYSLNTTYVPLLWNPFIDLLPSWTTIFTFIFVVASNIIGFFIISRKTINVKPMELFKNVG